MTQHIETTKHTPWNKGNGQGWVDKRGYRWLYVNENGRNVARRENRVVMERHLGRKLEPWELVHHKDEDKGNNAIDNLEIQTFGSHAALHHNGTRRSWETKRTMEAFALMREELARVRELNTELLEACTVALLDESTTSTVCDVLRAAITKSTPTL